MGVGVEALLVPSVIDQGGFDTFRGCYGGDAGDDAAHHPRAEVTERRQRSCFRVLEGFLDRVEGEETDAVFGYTSYDESRAAFIQRGQALGIVDAGYDQEWVLGGGLAFLLTELNAGFGELEGVLSLRYYACGLLREVSTCCRESLDCPCKATRGERHCPWRRRVLPSVSES